jgi:hypothetical protein
MRLRERQQRRLLRLEVHGNELPDSSESALRFALPQRVRDRRLDLSLTHSLSTPYANNQWLERLSRRRHHGDCADHIGYTIGKRIGPRLMATDQCDSVTRRFVEHDDTGVVVLVPEQPIDKTNGYSSRHDQHPLRALFEAALKHRLLGLRFLPWLKQATSEALLKPFGECLALDAHWPDTENLTHAGLRCRRTLRKMCG